jgi:deglycase
MMVKKLAGVQVAILANDMTEESELVEPRRALEEAGATTTLISDHRGEIISANHFDKSRRYKVDAVFNDVCTDDFDAVLILGGALNADSMRANHDAQNFVAQVDKDGKPIAVICHGPWLLISAGLVQDRHLTSFYTIRDDIKNAGGMWSNKPVVLDGNWISSRQPSDIPKFVTAIINILKTVTRIPRPAY